MTSQAFHLEVTDKEALQRYLWDKGHLDRSHKVTDLGSAGAGNMNCTLRVTTDNGSFILKQSRTYVERYPNIAAPLDRIHRETEFYNIVRRDGLLRSYTPEVLWSDHDNHLLALEDLGHSSDFTDIYRQGTKVDKKDIVNIAKALSELHFRFNVNTISERISNEGMRKLNHDHIFILPLNVNNGLNLDEACMGLHRATQKFRFDERLREMAVQLGHSYLEDGGTTLLHGDYYPGSWLNTPTGFRMIDPEFCFFGKPEFELAVAVAHLKLAKQPDELIKELFIYYHFDKRFDGSLFTKFVGMEIIRRLIGVAQLPLDLALQERLDLLEEARHWVLKG